VCRRSIARRAIVVRMPWLARGASGMTMGRVVMLKHREPIDGSSALIAHELVHVRQYFELGYLRFTARYLWAFGRLLLRERNHDRAYRAIPYEAEAYAEQRAWAARRAEA
jgi:hypothetical protein